MPFEDNFYRFSQCCYNYPPQPVPEGTVLNINCYLRQTERGYSCKRGVRNENY